jgi:Spy/CpxP family protein refolding chaperone
MKEINDFQYQAKKLTVDHLFAVHALLTPEQQKMFKGQLMKRLSGGEMRPMGHRWGGFRGGMPEGKPEEPAPR